VSELTNVGKPLTHEPTSQGFALYPPLCIRLVTVYRSYAYLQYECISWTLS
jgi:hypothetical protein